MAYTYCASFQPSGDSWISGPGEWEEVATAAECTRPYAIVRSDALAVLEAAANSGTNQPVTPTSSNPFDLSISEGSQVAGAILAIWAVAWSIKQIVRAINQDGDSSES
jgi:hypothetical protein